MNAAGWMLLAVSWSLILGLVGFCFFRVLRRTGSRPAKKD